MGGSKVERLQQRREVVAVLIDAAGRVRPLAARVTAAVIDNHPERLGQAGGTTNRQLLASPHDP